LVNQAGLCKEPFVWQCEDVQIRALLANFYQLDDSVSQLWRRFLLRHFGL